MSCNLKYSPKCSTSYPLTLSLLAAVSLSLESAPLKRWRNAALCLPQLFNSTRKHNSVLHLLLLRLLLPPPPHSSSTVSLSIALFLLLLLFRFLLLFAALFVCLCGCCSAAGVAAAFLLASTQQAQCKKLRSLLLAPSLLHLFALILLPLADCAYK